MVTQNKCNVNVGELIEFLSRRHGQGKFITDEYAVVLEAALKAAVARMKHNKLIYASGPAPVSELPAESEFAALVDKQKGVERGR